MSMRSNKTLIRVAFAALFPVCAAMSAAAYGQTAQTQPTATQRQMMGERHKKMAEMHSKMAACLESDKPFAQCRQEMTDTCATNFNGNCPMIGRGKMGGRGKGMMNGGGNCWDWMMNPDADAAPKAAKPVK